MYLCIDPGHGLSNRKRGIYDPGACVGKVEEAGIVLVWAHTLRAACVERGIPVFMTREKPEDDPPLMTRARRAFKQGCTHLISLHANHDDKGSANGYETLYRTRRSKSFATALHSQVKHLLGLRDRGVKARQDLGVIGNCGLDSVILELGFMSNAADLAVITDRAVMEKTCSHLAAHLAAWAQAHR